jgi:hypothetical protein
LESSAKLNVSLTTASGETILIFSNSLLREIIAPAFETLTRRHRLDLDYVSCSPFGVPIARLAAAQAALGEK